MNRDALVDRPYVSADGAKVRRSIFSDPQVYQRELDTVFSNCWLFLGHESQIPKPGDFFTTFMGEESVIVSRTQSNEIVAVVNTCPHRGATVCRADHGSARSFTCPYHGWTFNNEGALVGVPYADRVYGGKLDTSKNGLTPVPRLESYKGLLFGNYCASAQPLRDYLGKFSKFVDIWADWLPGGSEVVGGVVKRRIRSNWKILQDNVSGDEYHAPHNHLSAMQMAKMDPSVFMSRQQCFVPESGHSCAGRINPTSMLPIESVDAQDPELVAHLRSVHAASQDHLGPAASKVTVMAGAVFPNLGFTPNFHTMRAVHPKGPTESEVWSYCIVPAALPAHIKDKLRKVAQIGFIPTGIFQQDDMVVWEAATANSRMRHGSPDYDYSAGLGEERDDPEYGLMLDHVSEAPQRNFYRKWVSEMERSA